MIKKVMKKTAALQERQQWSN